MAARFTIVGLGEALFDLFPGGAVLGGAPLNVAVHAHQLGAPLGGQGVVASRVGQDDLGNQIIDQLRSRGMPTDYVQTDPDHDTGKVYVDMKPDGDHSFEIVTDVAWDWLRFDPDLESLAGKCDAVCFGTLAQRESESRSTIYRFLEAARRAIRLFDVNLRQDFFDARVIERSLEFANVIKLNEKELPVIGKLLTLRSAMGEPGGDWHDRMMAELIKRFDLKLGALTRGARGTALYTASDMVEAPADPAPAYAKADNADSVGAGDACSAGLMVGSVMRWPLQKTVNLANHMGAFVASQPGATPALPDSILAMVK